MCRKWITWWGSSSPESFGKRLHRILFSGPSFDPSIPTQTTFNFSKYSNFRTRSFVDLGSEASSSCIWRTSLSGCVWYILAGSRLSLAWTFFGRFLLLWPSSSSSTASSSNLEFSKLEDVPIEEYYLVEFLEEENPSNKNIQINIWCKVDNMISSRRAEPES